MMADFYTLHGAKSEDRERHCDPYKLQLELTYDCSLSCKFCCAPWKDHPELFGQELSTSEWFSLIDRYASSNIRLITLTGGEPLLRPDFAQIAEYIALLPFEHQCGVYTNLCDLSSEHEEVLSDHGFVVNTSLQGLSNWRQSARPQGDQTLSRWRENCKRLCQRGLPLVTTIVVTRETVHEMDRMVQFALDAGSRRVQIGPLMIEGEATRHPELWLNHDEIREIGAIIEDMRTVYGECISPRSEYFCKCRSDCVLPDGTPPNLDLGRCTAEEEFVIIGPSGRRRKCMHTWAD